MKNYVYLYYSNQDTPPSQEALEVWNQWFASLGDSVVDSGNPITRAKMVLKDGASTPEKDDIVGYSVVKAASLEAAVKMAMSCPLASAAGCAVRVYETGQM